MCFFFAFTPTILWQFESLKSLSTVLFSGFHFLVVFPLYFRTLFNGEKAFFFSRLSPWNCTLYNFRLAHATKTRYGWRTKRAGPYFVAAVFALVDQPLYEVTLNRAFNCRINGHAKGELLQIRKRQPEDVNLLYTLLKRQQREKKKRQNPKKEQKLENQTARQP